MAEQNTMTRSDARRAYNESVYGTNIPSSAEKKAVEEESRKQRLYREARESGKTEEEAKALVVGSGIGSATPRLDKMAYEQAQRQDVNAALMPESGDRSLPLKQLIRKFKGQAPLAETPEQFSSQLETSKGYGAESGLLTPSGRAKATESGIAAGLSPTEAQSQINASVASLLKDSRDKAKITQGLMGSRTQDYGIGVFASERAPVKVTPPATPVVTAPTKPVVPTVVSPTATAEQTTSSKETEIPEKPSDIAKMLVESAGIDTSTAAGVSNKARAVAQVAQLLSKYDVLDKANIATIMKAVQLPADVTRTSRLAGQLTRITGPLSKATPALTKLGKYAGPLRVVDPLLQASRYQNDEEFRQQQIEDTLSANEKGLAYTIGRAAVKGNPLNPLANPVPVLAATMEALMEARNILLGAEGEAAAQKLAKSYSDRRLESQLEERRKLYSDEAFAALTREQRKKLGETLKAVRDKNKR